MFGNYGKLYVVATPIGNLADFSYRAVEILQQVDLIAAEDTRHIRVLLQHYGITNNLISLHQYNENQSTPALVAKMQQGLSVALVSDAGTPLLSDPGMPLVKLAKESRVQVIPIPGACALIAALSASGLPVDQFCFTGFLPRTSAARKTLFSERLDWQTTWVFYESCHRILSCLEDMLTVFPPDREIVIAREMTKLHETIVKDKLIQVLALVQSDENMRKGEFVVIVDGAKPEKGLSAITSEEERILKILLTQCSIKTAVSLAAEISGARKKALYQAALNLSQTNQP